MIRADIGRVLSASVLSSIIAFGCGDEDSTNHVAVSVDSGTGTDAASPDASAGGSGGRTGNGGVGGSTAGNGGARNTGGSSGAAGDAGVDGGGNQCTPRADVPAPIPRTVSVEATCDTGSTCGGTIAGTTWEIESICFDEDRFFSQIRAACLTAPPPRAFDSHPSGTVSFTGTNVTAAVSVDIGASVDFPNSCGHGCRCTDFEATLQGVGVDARCNPVCNGGSCFCTMQKTLSLSSKGAYTATGGALTMPSGSDLTYCIAASDLSLRDAGAGVTYKLRPPAALHTPEICDGIDNDGNGTTDDALVECSTCSTTGACAGGVQATCSGSSGWSCTYTSPDWEKDETKCDAVDNDCDGELNEGLDCKEFCDGIDNDGVGGVDDNAFGPPICTKAGVCAGGNASQCKGTAGWACVASAATFEVAETKCDNVDNDCDGLTDERCCATGAARLYYAYIDAARTGSYIARMDPSGGNKQNLATLPLATLTDVALDPIGKKLYWGNLQNSIVQRSNPDGTNVETALPASSQPRVALDVAHRFIFWPGPGSLKRANLDNLTVVVDVPIPVTPLTMTVDSQHGWLYLGSGNLVHRADLDGSNHISIGASLPVAEVGQVIEGIAVDHVSSKVYWASAGGLHRANLDLTNPEQLITLSYPHHVQVDEIARRLYWSETVSNDIGYMDIGSKTPTYITTNQLSVQLGELVQCP